MPSICVISDNSEIERYSAWIDSKKFNSKNRFVNEIGAAISSEFSGRRYQIIAKKERHFSGFERVLRASLGLAATICSFGFALKFRFTQKLFTKQCETVRFATLIANPWPIDCKQLQLPHEDHYRFAGYDEELLKSIQDTIDDRQIPLHVCPKRPEGTFSVNQQKADAYINSLPTPYRETCIKAFANIRHISMAEFDKELQNCTQQLNQLLAGQDYAVGFVPGKSSQWVTSLALKDLDHPPISWFSLGRQSTNVVGGYDIKVPTIPLSLSNTTAESLVLFDDCGYSGEQIRETLMNLAKEIAKFKTPRKVFLVVPFLSHSAREKYSQCTSKLQGQIELSLITSTTSIPQAGDNLTNDEKKRFHELINTVDYRSNTLCYTDWRIPDGLSFPVGFGRFYMRKVIDGHDKNCEECPSCKLQKNEYFIPCSADVKRPYGFTK